MNKTSHQSIPINIRRISRTEEFQSMKDDWNNLLTQNHIQSAFLTWEWLFSWWKIYGEGKELWIIAAYEKEELVGALPLILSGAKKRSFLRVLRPLGGNQADVSGSLLKNKSEAVLLALSQYLLSNAQSWDVLELSNLFIHGCPVLSLIKSKFHEAGMVSKKLDADHLYMRLNGTWDEYLAGLSRKFRKNLRRATRSADKKGIVSLDHFSGEKATWQVFEKVIEINQHSNYPILYGSQNEQNFHKELFKYTTDKGILNFFFLSINQTLLAYEYGFLYNGRYEAWRAGYDTRFDPKISIGKLLFRMVVEKAFQLNYKEIDFLRGGESYKLEWNPLAQRYTKIRFIRKRNLIARFIFNWLADPKVMARFEEWLPKGFVEWSYEWYIKNIKREN